MGGYPKVFHASLLAFLLAECILSSADIMDSLCAPLSLVHGFEKQEHIYILERLAEQVLTIFDVFFDICFEICRGARIGAAWHSIARRGSGLGNHLPCLS